MDSGGLPKLNCHLIFATDYELMLGAPHQVLFKMAEDTQ